MNQSSPLLPKNERSNSSIIFSILGLMLAALVIVGILFAVSSFNDYKNCKELRTEYKSSEYLQKALKLDKEYIKKLNDLDAEYNIDEYRQELNELNDGGSAKSIARRRLRNEYNVDEFYQKLDALKDSKTLIEETEKLEAEYNINEYYQKYDELSASFVISQALDELHAKYKYDEYIQKRDELDVEWDEASDELDTEYNKMNSCKN